MKRFLLPLLALALAAGAASCQSSTTKPVAAVPAGSLQTAWGKMPTYHPAGGGPPFQFSARPRAVLPAELRADAKTVLDVLIDRDGSVREVKVQTSSGFKAADEFAMDSLVGARSRLLVAANDPAPYVVRFTYAVETFNPSEIPGGSNGLGLGNSDNRDMGTGAHYAGDR